MTFDEFMNKANNKSQKEYGVLTWLADSVGVGPYKTLTKEDQKQVLIEIYNKYSDHISRFWGGIMPFEGIVRRVVAPYEIFELIVCIHLINLKKKTDAILCSVGDYTLPENNGVIENINAKFTVLKTAIKGASPNLWIQDCISILGKENFLEWLDNQTAFLSAKIISMSKDTVINYAKTASSDNDRALPYDRMDLSKITHKDVQKELDKMSCTSEFRNKLQDLVASLTYSHARSLAYPDSYVPVFNNIIISGSPGVGKTTSARLIAKYLAANNVMRTKTAAFVTAGLLIGKLVGDPEYNIHELFAKNRGGVIIIDEADSLVSRTHHEYRSYQAARDALTATIGNAKDNNDGTIVILTGYKSGITSLLNANEGLKRRFPHCLHLEDYDIAALERTFINIAKSRTYRITHAHIKAAVKELTIAKDYLGNKFGNAGTIEEFLNKWETTNAKRMGLHKLQDVISSGSVAAETRDIFSTLHLCDAPQFDKESKSFITRHLSLVSERLPAQERGGVF